MTEFAYRGIGPQDTAVEGHITAANHAEANKLLEQMQVRVTELRAVKAEVTPRVKPISRDDFIMLNEQIIAMVKAGAPLEEGLRQLAYDLAKPRLRKLVTEITEDLACGTPLEEAIRKRQQAFPTLYAQIVAVGMRTGRLAVVLAGLNRHLEFVGSMRRMVWEALNYPLVILLLGMGVLWWTTRMIAPGLRDMFADFGTDLPGLTLAAFRLADNLAWLFPTLMATVVIIVIVVRSARSPRARQMKEGFLLSIPGCGTMLKNCLVARFAQGLALMVRVGIPLEESVLMAGEATGSPGVASDSRRIGEALSRGESVHQALQMGRILPRFLGQMVQIALERSQLEESLEELSRLYDQQAQRGLGTLRAMLLPLAVAITAGIIGLYILAMFLPLVKLISTIGG